MGDEVHDADERGSGANATRGGAMALPSGEDAGKSQTAAKAVMETAAMEMN